MSNYKQTPKDKNYTELLQVAEMYRDQMLGNPAEHSIAYTVCDVAIKNYYKINPCPHRWLKAIKPVKTACGCETTVIVCQDCGTDMTIPITDC